MEGMHIRELCAMHNVRDTPRQASKFRNGYGELRRATGTSDRPIQNHPAAAAPHDPEAARAFSVPMWATFERMRWERKLRP